MQTHAKLETGGETDSSEQLAQRLADDDLDAPRDLVRKYYPELYRYALSMLRDQMAAQDAVQSSFEKAFAALGRYSEERIRILALRPWLYRITLNVVRNTLRSQKWETPLAEVPEVPEVPEGPRQRSVASGAGEKQNARESWLDVAVALGLLPERQRTAVALRYLVDLPYAEISEATGWPESTAKTLVRRGIVRLQILLLDEAERKEANS